MAKPRVGAGDGVERNVAQPLVGTHYSTQAI